MSRWKGKDGRGVDVLQWLGNKEATERFLNALGVKEEERGYAWGEERQAGVLTFNETPEGRESGEAMHGDFLVVESVPVEEPTEENPNPQVSKRVKLVPREDFLAQYGQERPAEGI